MSKSVSGRQRWLGLALVCLTFVGSVSVHCSRSGAGEPPERIILLIVDTMRRDHVSAYTVTAPAVSPGDSKKSEQAARSPLAKTPNIDRLANTGQVFRNAVSAFHATTMSMSMSALFTGLTPSIESGTRNRSLKWNTFASRGMSRFSVPGKDQGCVPQSLETLAEDLQGAGYWTLDVVSNELCCIAPPATTGLR